MTTTDISEITKTLNELIETCKDGENGFKEAGDKAKDASLKALFLKYSAQRAGYAQELQAAVSLLGETPETTEHVAAKLHRGWMGLKQALTKNEDKALIDECEAGEDAAIKAYKEALEKPLPGNVETLVRHQFTGVSQAHGVIRDLKHSRN
jgi:uncharacterized protein (TIGR02284 family)